MKIKREEEIYFTLENVIYVEPSYIGYIMECNQRVVTTYINGDINHYKSKGRRWCYNIYCHGIENISVEIEQ